MWVEGPESNVAVFLQAVEVWPAGTITDEQTQTAEPTGGYTDFTVRS